MRYLYYVILLVAILAYPAARALAMESPPTDPSQAVAPEDETYPPAYVALQKLLEHYQRMAAEGGWPHFDAGHTKIEPGAHSPRIAIVRDILRVMGDYDGDSPADPALYDPALEEAVKRFQRRHGLTDDGIIGKSTQQALAVPIEKRIRQIEGTMKRVLGLNAASSRFLIVNIPEFMLRAYENGQKVMEMKVIVGDVKNHTPRFDNAISYVSFNPHWGVPTRITTEELLPKIIENPYYIAENDYAVYDMREGSNQEIDPTTIDWTSLEANPKTFPYFLRQRPGRGNALGKIKFGLKGSDGIYLHSTSAPRLFEKDYRALSHGCIRVEKPRELTHFIFQAMEDYDNARIDARYDSSESKIVKVEPLPVHLVYWTAWVDENGVANFRKDIYGLD